MSDPKFGEPVEENPSQTELPPVEDVVGRANDSLAEAEAASRDAVSGAAPSDPSTSNDFATVTDAAVDHDALASKLAASDADSALPGATEPAAAPREVSIEPPAASTSLATDAYDRDFDDSLYTSAATTPVTGAGDDAATRAYTPEAITPSEPVAPAVVAPTVPAAHQPIFVQAPEAPRTRGNRLAAGGIGLLAAVVFALLYAGILFGLSYFFEAGTAEDPIGTLQLMAMSIPFWTTVAVFWIAFWLLGAIINTGRWGQWVIWGLLVGLATLVANALGLLIEAPFWEITAREGAELFSSNLITVSSFIAFVLGRELTIWFGAWVAARGRRVIELNAEAQREYERILEAGPQLQNI